MRAPFLLFSSLAGISLVAIIAPGTHHRTEHREPVSSVVAVAPVPASTPRNRIAAGAQSVVARKSRYYETYETIKYPGGDVPADYGVCTDLVIRAFRNAGVDLQMLLHEDRKKNPAAYPTQLWDYKKPDANIDHRRCQNLAVFLARRAVTLTTAITSNKLTQWQPGDVVFFVKEGARHPWHVAIISDERDNDRMPMIYHLFPPHARIDRLDEFGPIHSHFRWK